MATNPNVERMRKMPAAASQFSVPPLPEIPENVRTVQDIRAWYNAEMKIWWTRFQTVLKEQLDNLRS
jgi:hypothetical protein